MRPRILNKTSAVTLVEYGLRMDAGSSSRPISSAWDEPDRRDLHNHREPRERRLIRGEMETDRLPRHNILIRNISPRGLGASCRGLPPMVEETASIRLPDGQVITGMVRWVREQEFGVRFDRPVNLDAVFGAIQRMKAMAEASAHWEVKPGHRVAVHLVGSSLRRL